MRYSVLAAQSTKNDNEIEFDVAIRTMSNEEGVELPSLWLRGPAHAIEDIGGVAVIRVSALLTVAREAYNRTVKFARLSTESSKYFLKISDLEISPAW